MLIKRILSILIVLGVILPFGTFAATDGSRNFTYVLKGKRKGITVNLDSSVYNYMYNIPRLPCPTCSSLTERDRVIITEPTQKANLAPLVAAIKAQAKKPDDQARIAVSLVQNIPYDTAKSDAVDRGESTHFRYPYEVLYDNLQICSENSYLLAFLLTELGFGAAVFVFPQENHDTVGIKCPAQYSYKNTGYCFIESTYRNIVTYNTMANRYSGDMILEDLTPNGYTFNPKNDYKDAQSLKSLYDKQRVKALSKKIVRS